MTFSHRSFVENNEENVKLLHKCRERELIMTDAQCRSGGGESSLLALYKLLLPPATTSYIAFTSQIAPGVDACQLASGFALPLLLPLPTSILLDLSLLIFSFTFSQALNSHEPTVAPN